MKYRYEADSSLRLTDDSGPWFETRLEALNARIVQLEEEMQHWTGPAIEALEKDDPYKGGAVLKLAELMREVSFIKSRRPIVSQMALP